MMNMGFDHTSLTKGERLRAVETPVIRLDHVAARTELTIATVFRGRTTANQLL